MIRTDQGPPCGACRSRVAGRNGTLEPDLVFIGTPSWADPGFVADWYPPKLLARERLPFYSERFDAVEVNSTHYALPDDDTVARWAQVTPEGFTFDVKVHRLLSRHAGDPDSLPSDLRELATLNARGRVQLTDELERALAVSAQSELGALASKIRSHRGCGFEPCETCINPVPGEGSATAAVAFVGEAPGRQEDAQGRPFVGVGGRLLDELLASIELERQDVFITNVLKARRSGNRDPRVAEIAHSWRWLSAQLELVRPRVVVPLGRHALGCFVPGAKITATRGSLQVVGGWAYLHAAPGSRAARPRSSARDVRGHRQPARSACRCAGTSERPAPRLPGCGAGGGG